MKKNFKNLKIIVTGSTGFKGAWLCHWLNLLGGRVVGIGLKPEKNSIIFKALKLDKKIDQKFIDIKYFNKLNDVIKKIKPDIYFKGPDYKKNKNDLTGKIVDEKKAIKRVGGQIKFSKSGKFSSLNLPFSSVTVTE